MWAHGSPAGGWYLLLVAIAAAAEGTLNRAREPSGTHPVVLIVLCAMVLAALIWFVAVVFAP
jgi:hypothetical protein